MANEEQNERLWAGVGEWNKWREENPNEKIDLSKAYLRLHTLNGINLEEANLVEANLEDNNLEEANLWKANLWKANLRNANLRKANLKEADFRDAELYRTDFTEANLEGAHFVGAYLREARLCKANLGGAGLIGAVLILADLREADLKYAHLGGADLTHAILVGTNFERTTFNNTHLASIDLSQAKGLEAGSHPSPSYISTDTLQLSKGKIPVAFLRGCGLSDVDIEYAKLANPELSNQEINTIVYKIYDLRATRAIQINPLFISYSHKDSTFVDAMEKRLDEKGIRFWRDIHDATSGRLEKVVNRAMRFNPTVLLVLSENSVKSDWVEHEARLARELEKELGRDVLCPVTLDDAWKDCAWPARLREQIMEYNILDFSKWKDEEEFGKMFRKLIDGLDLFYKEG
jgi:hypothetical protein